MKFKKLSLLMGVGLMTYLSTLGQTNLVQTQAALTKPTSYDYSFEYQSSTSRFEYTTESGQSRSSFTRTVDGAYFNYTQTNRSLWVHPDYDGIENNQYLSVDTTFNRSNTTWNDYVAFSGAPTRYEPTSTNVGSTNSVGTATNKVYLKFENQTNKDYLLYIDISSTASGSFAFRSIYDLVSQYDALPQTGALISLPLYAFSTFEFFRLSTSSAVYFDAWYLKDLGVSAAYDQGIEDGYDEAYQDGLNNNPNILLSGFQAMVGILINMALMVLNLTVFDVSLLSIFSIMALFVGVIWILKLVRG
jgi:hypothetical protein